MATLVEIIQRWNAGRTKFRIINGKISPPFPNQTSYYQLKDSNNRLSIRFCTKKICPALQELAKQENISAKINNIARLEDFRQIADLMREGGEWEFWEIGEQTSKVLNFIMYINSSEITIIISKIQSFIDATFEPFCNELRNPGSCLNANDENRAMTTSVTKVEVPKIVNLEKIKVNSMNEKIEPIKSFRDESWGNFIEECKEQVESDNKNLGINSMFLPNPEICHNPTYCLIAMEPLDDMVDILSGSLAKKIKEGLKNSIEGKGGPTEIILHYCAYHYLGEEGFNYYFTDFTKGSMDSNDAQKAPATRYKSWKKLLEKELSLLGNPISIAVGTATQNAMNLERSSTILHYGDNAAKARNKEYEYIKEHDENIANYLKDIDKKELLKFARDFMNHLKYNRRDKVIGLINKRELTDTEKNTFALYRHNFETLTKKGKIFRRP